MNNKNLRQIFAAALVAALTLAGCKKQETPVVETPAPTSTAPAPAPAPVTVTASISGIDLGTAVGADMKVVTPSSTFATKDTIIAAVATATSDPAGSVTGKLNAKWTFGDGQVVNEESKDVVFTGSGVTDFQVSKPDGWPAGTYQFQAWLDDGVVQSRFFEVK